MRVRGASSPDVPKTCGQGLSVAIRNFGKRRVMSHVQGCEQLPPVVIVVQIKL